MKIRSCQYCKLILGNKKPKDNKTVICESCYKELLK